MRAAGDAERRLYTLRLHNFRSGGSALNPGRSRSVLDREMTQFGWSEDSRKPSCVEASIR